MLTSSKTRSLQAERRRHAQSLGWIDLLRSADQDQRGLPWLKLLRFRFWMLHDKNRRALASAADAQEKLFRLRLTVAQGRGPSTGG